MTEDLALRFGDTIGGLLNATFGNVVELCALGGGGGAAPLTSR